MLTRTLLVLAIAVPAFGQSSTLTVLSSNATKAVVEDLGPQFEKTGKQKIVFKFGNSAELKARIEKGEAFDVAILTAPLVGELVTLGKLTAATRTDIARAGAGMAVHAQATKPDISTADALKGALINARSIAYVGQGATAVIMRSIFEKFGITEAMNAKTKLVASAAHAVAAKEAELGFTQISEILNVPGAVLAGPLPAGLQVYTTFQAATSAASASPAAAAFIKFLVAPAAAAVIKTKGMEPISPEQDRLPPMTDAQLTPAQRQAVADFKTARGVEISGPFYPLLRSPELMTRARAMGDYLRYKSALPPRLSEFVILITAREWTQQYEWNAHYQIALKAGVSPEVANAIAEGRRPPAMSDEEAILYDFCQELHKNKSVSETTYARAIAKFGEQAVVDTVGISGYYTLLAMVLNTARTPAGQSTAPTLRPLPR
jgi:4-carboxymuconolactone decarboxylase